MKDLEIIKRQPRNITNPYGYELVEKVDVNSPTILLQYGSKEKFEKSTRDNSLSYQKQLKEFIDEHSTNTQKEG